MNEFIKLSFNVPITEAGILDNDFIIQGVAINATTTGNNHKFLAEELRSSAETLRGVPLLVDHRNEVGAIKGRVTAGEYDEQNSRVNFKAKVVDSDIKRMVKEGLINSVSIGAAVREIEEKDDVLIPRGIVFKELSLVAVPADGGATFTTALLEAYNLIKSPKTMDSISTINAQSMATYNSQSLPKKEEDITLMNGGIKMSEEIAETKKEVVKAEVPVIQSIDLTELKAIQADISAKLAEMKVLSEKAKEPKKTEAKVDAKVEIAEQEDNDMQEVGKYKIVQGFGSLRGASFTLVR